MSQQSKYGAVEVAEAPAATPCRARGVVLALSLLAGGALYTAGGVASQSGGRASDGIYTTGSATVRDGAGQGSVPAGLGVSD